MNSPEQSIKGIMAGMVLTAATLTGFLQVPVPVAKACPVDHGSAWPCYTSMRRLPLVTRDTPYDVVGRGIATLAPRWGRLRARKKYVVNSACALYRGYRYPVEFNAQGKIYYTMSLGIRRFSVSS